MTAKDYLQRKEGNYLIKLFTQIVHSLLGFHQIKKLIEMEF